LDRKRLLTNVRKQNAPGAPVWMNVHKLNSRWELAHRPPNSGQRWQTRLNGRLVG